MRSQFVAAAKLRDAEDFDGRCVLDYTALFG